MSRSSHRHRRYGIAMSVFGVACRGLGVKNRKAVLSHVNFQLVSFSKNETLVSSGSPPDMELQPKALAFKFQHMRKWHVVRLHIPWFCPRQPHAILVAWTLGMSHTKMRFSIPSRFFSSNAIAACNSSPIGLNVIRVHNMHVFDMLRLEESLFRHDSSNWCVINSGTPPCVVVGRSSVIEDTVHVENTRASGIPIIRRFTGGGVVYVWPSRSCDFCS